ncbi:uncharacterized protein G2W53_041953 [Senna tora]|uniref:Uncharacterized protein n=1 Tax=Senna tora TaxID=362788 RepID=A0A834SG53_9FABA|nr:uncharacterized protein G2W53_041953 [Senna tora]
MAKNRNVPHRKYTAVAGQETSSTLVVDVARNPSRAINKVNGSVSILFYNQCNF